MQMLSCPPTKKETCMFATPRKIPGKSDVQQPCYTTRPATVLEKRGPPLCLGASHQKGVICDAEESGEKDSG